MTLVPGASRAASVALVATSVALACASGPSMPESMSFSSEPLPGKVVWHDLITDDIESARAFYGELFGWTFESSTGEEGRPYSVAQMGNVYVAGLLEVPDPADGADYSRWLPFVSVPDVDRAMGRVTSQGGWVAVQPQEVRFGRVAALIDPEGAVIGLARSSIGDPDDPTTAPASGRPVWTELISDDPERAAEFYQRVVGYEARTVDRRGGEYTVLEAGGRDRAGILKNPAVEWDPVWLTYFGVDDAEAAATRAESLGGTVVLPVSEELREGTMAVVADPGGAILVLQEWSAQ